MKYAGYVGAAAVGVLLLVLFAMALPAAAARARTGLDRRSDALCGALEPTPDNPTLGSFPVAAPDFTLKDYAGRSVTLSQLRGNVVLVNFWATWCKTCVVEMPSMERMVAHMQGKPFRLLAVSIDDDWPTVRKFFEHGTDLDVLLDADKEVPKAYGTSKFPESFIVDKTGTIRYYVVSDRDWTRPAIEACLDSLAD
ncbi:MAG: peroxiredoxin family protein [Polyangia bacterium]|jgi:peroxiredoxin